MNQQVTANKMIRAFRTAGLTVSEPSFFGIPFSETVTQAVILAQPKATPAKAPGTFTMLKRPLHAA